MINPVVPQSYPTSGAGPDANKERSGETSVSRRTMLQSESNGAARDSESPESTTPKDSVTLSAEAREIEKLAQRDREVRAHEAAHAAVGGRYAGPPSLTYKKGPDGKSYAISGEVSISVVAVHDDPQATLQKAEVIRAAALAPMQPSSQDMRVAARAAAMATQARAELATQDLNGMDGTSEPDAQEASTPVSGEAGVAEQSTRRADFSIIT